MLDHRFLQNAVALLDRLYALAFLLELGPTVEHIDELEVTFMDVPLLNFVCGFVVHQEAKLKQKSQDLQRISP